MQSITAGADLPSERQNLQKYIPHDRSKTALNSKWQITLQSCFFEIKNDTSSILHLEKYKVYMNTTNISYRNHQIQGFDLHVHHCRQQHKQDMQ
eukprot:1435090-Ditylum_brightwellii.AAC.1